MVRRSLPRTRCVAPASPRPEEHSRMPRRRSVAERASSATSLSTARRCGVLMGTAQAVPSHSSCLGCFPHVPCRGSGPTPQHHAHPQSILHYSTHHHPSPEVSARRTGCGSLGPASSSATGTSAASLAPLARLAHGWAPAAGSWRTTRPVVFRALLATVLRDLAPSLGASQGRSADQGLGRGPGLGARCDGVGWVDGGVGAVPSPWLPGAQTPGSGTWGDGSLSTPGMGMPPSSDLKPNMRRVAVRGILW